MCDSHDYLHSGISQTYFSKLELSGNFDSETSVFPQSVFTELQLLPELEKVLPDGRIILNLDGDDNQENTPLISMSLFGRKFGDDGLHQSNGAHMEIFLRILARDVTMVTVKFL